MLPKLKRTRPRSYGRCSAGVRCGLTIYGRRCGGISWLRRVGVSVCMIRGINSSRVEWRDSPRGQGADGYSSEQLDMFERDTSFGMLCSYLLLRVQGVGWTF